LSFKIAFKYILPEGFKKVALWCPKTSGSKINALAMFVGIIFISFQFFSVLQRARFSHGDTFGVFGADGSFGAELVSTGWRITCSVVVLFSPIGINRWTLSHQLKGMLPVQRLGQFAKVFGGEDGEGVAEPIVAEAKMTSIINLASAGFCYLNKSECVPVLTSSMTFVLLF
jgi:hypothetical protein